MKTIRRNNPIATVIKNFLDKKSGKVTESRNEIQARFFGLDWKDQKRILAAFLESGKADREWAYSRLLHIWDPCFEKKVKELWEESHEEKCTWVVIRHFPKAYLKEHIDCFCLGRNYYFVCRRLVEDADFVIDKKKLSNTDYLMALAHGNRHIEDEEAKKVLFSIVREIGFYLFPALEISRNYIYRRDGIMLASDFKDVAIALYYLKKMGNKELVAAFQAWEREVQTKVSQSEEYKALCKRPQSDYDFKNELAGIVQKLLYIALYTGFLKHK